MFFGSFAAEQFIEQIVFPVLVRFEISVLCYYRTARQFDIVRFKIVQTDLSGPVCFDNFGGRRHSDLRRIDHVSYLVERRAVCAAAYSVLVKKIRFIREAQFKRGDEDQVFVADIGGR